MCPTLVMRLINTTARNMVDRVAHNAREVRRVHRVNDKIAQIRLFLEVRHCAYANEEDWATLARHRDDSGAREGVQGRQGVCLGRSLYPDAVLVRSCAKAGSRGRLGRPRRRYAEFGYSQPTVPIVIEVVLCRFKR